MGTRLMGYWDVDDNFPYVNKILEKTGDYLIVNKEGISNITGKSESYQLGDQLEKTATGFEHRQYANLNARIVSSAQTYADALLLASGSQWKEIKVIADETDGGNSNYYKYDGIEGQLELVF